MIKLHLEMKIMIICLELYNQAADGKSIVYA